MKRAAVIAALLVLVVATTAWAGQETFQGFQVLKLLVNGREQTSATPAIVMNGTPMVPLQAIADGSGGRMTWDQSRGSVDLTLTSDVRLLGLQTRVSQLEAELKALKSATAVSFPIITDEVDAKTGEPKRELPSVKSDIKTLYIAARLNAGSAGDLTVKWHLEGQHIPNWDTTSAYSSSYSGWTSVKLTAGPDGLPAGNYRVDFFYSGKLVSQRTFIVEKVAKAAPPPESKKTPDPDGLMDYLNKNLSSVDTPLGTVSISYDYIFNEHTWSAYDYWIQMEYAPTTFFSDLQYKVGVTAEQRASTIQALRDHARKVYDVSIKYLPGKKLYGQYYHGWYRYPSVQVGYEAVRYLTWKNYTESSSGLNSYNSTKPANFHFDPFIDDAKF